MKPIYLDLHIHTSEDEENLNQNYDVDLLLSKIQDFSIQYGAKYRRSY